MNVNIGITDETHISLQPFLNFPCKKSILFSYVKKSSPEMVT